MCNLSVSEDNFAVAWKLLVSRYENKRFLINSQLDRITNLKPLKTKSAQGLRALLTTISEATGALSSFGCAVHHWDPLLLHLLVRLLDPETREAWEVNLGSISEYPTYTQFEEFLVARTRALENLHLHGTTFGSHKENSAGFSGKQRMKVSAHLATQSNTGNPSCPLCGSSHYLAKCDEYQTKTLQQRRDIIIKQKRCFNCLGTHTASKCSSTRRCQKCGKKHHTSIHDNSDKFSTKHKTDAQVKTATAQSTDKSQHTTD